MLTGSPYWGLESPFLFDHFEVATWMGVTCLMALRPQTVLLSACTAGNQIVLLMIYSFCTNAVSLNARWWVLHAADGFDGGVVIRQRSRGEPGDATAKSIHILLPPHGLGPMETYANSIVHSPDARFIHGAGIYTALAWRNKTVWITHVPSGKAS